MTLFFATNFIEIVQAQNIVSILKIPKEKAILILWVQDIAPELESKVEQNLFSDIIFLKRPRWKDQLKISRSNLKKSTFILTTIIQDNDIKEIFIPDPECDFQILEYICRTNNIHLSLFETGIELYRYLEEEDPNHFSIRHRISRLFFLCFALFRTIQKLFRQRLQLKNIIFYDMFPEIGQFLFHKEHRKILFRLRKFYRCFCSNPDILVKLYDVEHINTLSFEHIVSTQQQMTIFSSPDFWDISPNSILFIDPDYIQYGITMQQHVSIVMRCLEYFGRTNNIIIKPNWALAHQISDIYKKEISKKGYKIQVISSEVLAETIVIIKNIRKLLSLASSSYIYSTIMQPNIRAMTFYQKYEEILQEVGVQKKILTKIKKHHEIFRQVLPNNQEQQQKIMLNDSFFIYKNH